MSTILQQQDVKRLRTSSYEREFNQRLADRIKEYWRKKGQDAFVYVSMRSSPKGSNMPAIYSVKSNIVDGYPDPSKVSNGAV